MAKILVINYEQIYKTFAEYKIKCSKRLTNIEI